MPSTPSKPSGAPPRRTPGRTGHRAAAQARPHGQLLRRCVATASKLVCVAAGTAPSRMLPPHQHKRASFGRDLRRRRRQGLAPAIISARYDSSLGVRDRRGRASSASCAIARHGRASTPRLPPPARLIDGASDVLIAGGARPACTRCAAGFGRAARPTCPSNWKWSSRSSETHHDPYRQKSPEAASAV